jgi:hypothetical protein
MRLTSIRSGDIVQVDKLGDRFYALVRGYTDRKGEIEVIPVSNGRAAVRFARAREIVGHWRQAGRPRNGGD